MPPAPLNPVAVMEQVEISIDLPPAEYYRLEKAANAAGMTMEDWFRHVLAEAMAAREEV